MISGGRSSFLFNYSFSSLKSLEFDLKDDELMLHVAWRNLSMVKEGY